MQDPVSFLVLAVSSSSCFLVTLLLITTSGTNGGQNRAPGFVFASTIHMAAPQQLNINNNHHHQQQHQNQHQNATLAAGSAAGPVPYWHRPGCYQVGHTRTISIPGCVKFNLSTNACRGFCMSFSIPAPEDVGPPLLEQLDGSATGETPQRPSQLVVARPTLDSQQIAELLNQQAAAGDGGGVSRLEQLSADQAEDQAAQLARRVIDRRRRVTASSPGQVDSNGGGGSASKTSGKHLGDFLHLAGQTKSPLAGTVGDLSDKRDVISVGQCCNMMETEDVTVNLRCGLNETRRLVFKSAKTCECFFCKHV